MTSTFLGETTGRVQLGPLQQVYQEVEHGGKGTGRHVLVRFFIVDCELGAMQWWPKRCYHKLGIRHGSESGRDVAAAAPDYLK